VSNVRLWGTGLSEPLQELDVRVTPEGDVRVTPEGDTRLAPVGLVVVTGTRVTPNGDTRVTPEGDTRIVDFGLSGPRFYQTADVTQDGPIPFGFSLITDPWQPDAQGGECVFWWAYCTVTHSASATLEVWGRVDGGPDSTAMPDGSTLRTLRTVFALPQQDGTLQRRTTVIAVPLARVVERNGREVARYALRGQRLQVVMQNLGPLGVGELILDGIEVEVQRVRKAAYPGQAVTR
jgi:hypothetical protein